MAILNFTEGAYRFRADLAGTPFWSSQTDDCVIPGCTEVDVLLPGAFSDEIVTTTIDYSYDDLYRLTAADYDNGTFFHYAYDAVGNRLTQTTDIATISYAYDNANRLVDVAGQAYTWDANGNLLSDGTGVYNYDAANRLTQLAQSGVTYDYSYNGMGDRYQQSVDALTTTYQLDLAAGLTQTLSDGTDTYLYGLGCSLTNFFTHNLIFSNVVSPSSRTSTFARRLEKIKISS